MKLKSYQRIDYPTAKRRAMSYMSHRRLYKASEIGNAIWPDNNMHAQGLGAAASRILKRMTAEGIVSWRAVDDNWGYCLTKAGE